MESHIAARVDDHDEFGGPFEVRWEGGHGLHLYSREGKEIAYRTVGDQSRPMTLEEARKEVEEWARWIESGDAEALEF